MASKGQGQAQRPEAAVAGLLKGGRATGVLIRATTHAWRYPLSLWIVQGVSFAVKMRLLICSLAVLSSAAFADVRIDARSAIVVDPTEPAALRRAVADLAADMTKVFGAPARVMSSRAHVRGEDSPGTVNQDGPPRFRYRGWFINDEDLLTGWKPDRASGFSLEIWDKIFETLPRLKGNMIWRSAAMRQRARHGPTAG